MVSLGHWDKEFLSHLLGMENGLHKTDLRRDKKCLPLWNIETSKEEKIKYMRQL